MLSFIHVCKHFWSLSSHSHLHTDSTSKKMVVHLKLVSLRAPSQYRHLEGWWEDGTRSSQLVLRTRGNLQQKHQNPRKGKYLCSNKISFQAWGGGWQELKGTVDVLHLTPATHRKQSTERPKWGFCNRKNSQLPQLKSKGTHILHFQTICGLPKKRKKGCFLALCPPPFHNESSEDKGKTKEKKQDLTRKTKYIIYLKLEVKQKKFHLPTLHKFFSAFRICKNTELRKKT